VPAFGERVKRNRKQGPLGSYFAALITGCLVSSCGGVDRFADHSVEYNMQAEAIKNQNILNNIIRSAYRKPLQFTDLSTITGQVSVSGTAAFTVPFGGPRSGFLFSPSVTESDTPNFTVAVLNTQEFYNGILRPIPPQLISYYISQGYPRNVLFTLLVSEIEKENEPPLYNVPGYYSNFVKELEDLIDQGLTVQPVNEEILLGPPLTAKEVQRMDIAKLDAQQITIAHDGMHYQLKKSNIVYRFCLRPPTNDATGTCIRTLEQSDAPAPDNSGKVGRYSVKLAGEKIGIHVRSVEGIIYYLGEWAREEIEGIGGSAKPPPTVKDKNLRCQNEPRDTLFRLEQGVGQEPSISTFYQGKDYHIVVDPKGCDRSSQVVELVLELLALNNSAKDLPAPSVIPILTR
jgi:hypothetical protein